MESTLRTACVRPWSKAASDMFTTGVLMSCPDSWTEEDLAVAAGCVPVGSCLGMTVDDASRLSAVGPVLIMLALSLD